VATAEAERRPGPRAVVALQVEGWREAWGAALVARFVTARRFPAGHDAPWIDAWRRRRWGESSCGPWRRTPRPASRRAGPSWPRGTAPGPASQQVHLRLLQLADDQSGTA